MFSIETLSAALIHRRRQMPETNPTPKGKRLACPAPRAPRIFADTAILDEIKPLLDAGIVDGVTTNPTLLKRAGARSWNEANAILTKILRTLEPFPVSLELTQLTAPEMVGQAEELNALGANAVIKVPVGGYKAVDERLDPYTGL